MKSVLGGWKDCRATYSDTEYMLGNIALALSAALAAAADCAAMTASRFRFVDGVSSWFLPDDMEAGVEED